MNTKKPDSRSAINKFMKAEREAFDKINLEYGEVKFKCPICGGHAWSSREYTPYNIHEITLRCGCKDCGFIGMN